MDDSVLDFIHNPNQYYLSNKENIDIKNIPDIKAEDIVFIHVAEITFEEKAPRKEALENVLSSVRIAGTNFIYLVVGDCNKVSFYYGLSKDLVQEYPLENSLSELGEEILMESLKGNFRGSKLRLLSTDETVNLVRYIRGMKCHDYIDGVPGVVEDKEHFQSIDRLVDTMINDEFAFMVVAKYFPYEVIQIVEKNLYKFYNKLVPYSKKNVQKATNESVTIVDTKNGGTNTTYTLAKTTGKSKNHGKTIGSQRSVATHYEGDETRTDTTSSNDNEGAWSETDNKTETNGSSTVNNTTTGTNKTNGTNQSEGREFINKDIQEWMKYIDDVLLKRLDYGKGKGIYISTIAISSQGKLQLKKLENTITSLFSSGAGNKVPIMKYEEVSDKNRLKVISNFQIPLGFYKNKINDDEVNIRAVLSQYSGHKSIFCGNWFSTDELSIIAGLPQKEIVGLPLREEVEFGLNIKDDLSADQRIELGKLVQSGQSKDNISVVLNRDDLDKHIFITGVTGSGKTTTCQNILLKSNLPFCVIEPAKTEYRILTDVYDDLLVFTLGKDKVCPFRLNPFEFFKHESIASHVDMIKASIESAFDMEAAIPQIIETALYQCYEDCGWDISDDTNSLYDDPFAPGNNSFPTLHELINKSVEVVKAQGFDERLKSDYIGSIRARLMGLLAGSKGLMLNTYRSVNFKDLLHKHVVIELEEIRSTEEKSLIMGFIISNLMEAIRAEFYDNPGFKHITLIEEAHRLLSRYQPGDPMTKKQGVEMFSNMLAEVRKYGESLIIVDQIPSKLATDVLKNTNTKIVHKIFAQDDKEAIGNTMSMSDEQKNFLSSLGNGRAIVFSQGWDKPVQTHVNRVTNTTSKDMITDDEIRSKCIDYLYENWKIGIVPGIDCLNECPSKEVYEKNLDNQNMYRKLNKYYGKCMNDKRVSEEVADIFEVLGGILGKEALAKYILKNFYFKESKDVEKILYANIVMLINEVHNKNLEINDFEEDLGILCKSKRRI